MEMMEARSNMYDVETGREEEKERSQMRNQSTHILDQDVGMH